MEITRRKMITGAATAGVVAVLPSTSTALIKDSGDALPPHGASTVVCIFMHYEQAERLGLGTIRRDQPMSQQGVIAHIHRTGKYPSKRARHGMSFEWNNDICGPVRFEVVGFHHRWKALEHLHHGRLKVHNARLLRAYNDVTIPENVVTVAPEGVRQTWDSPDLRTVSVEYQVMGAPVDIVATYVGGTRLWYQEGPAVGEFNPDEPPAMEVRYHVKFDDGTEDWMRL